MFFWLKKLLGYSLMPLPFSFGLIAVGFILLWGNWKRRLGKALILTGLAWLLICSNSAVSRLFLRPLESRYPAIPEIASPAQVPASLASCRYVAVLGGGHFDQDSLPSNSRLSDSSLSRLTEGIRIAFLLPDSRLIVSGSKNLNGQQSHGQIQKRAAIALGFPAERILVVESARDTDDESLEIGKIAAGERIALVTSAWHMPRSAALFTRKGVAIVPCPADFKGKGNVGFTFRDYGWDAESLARSSLAVREYIGLLWSKLRRQT